MHKKYAHPPAFFMQLEIFADGLFPRAVSQADTLARPFGERREGQYPAAYAALTIFISRQLAAGELTTGPAFVNEAVRR